MPPFDDKNSLLHKLAFVWSSNLLLPYMKDVRVMKISNFFFSQTHNNYQSLRLLVGYQKQHTDNKTRSSTESLSQ